MKKGLIANEQTIYFILAAIVIVGTVLFLWYFGAFARTIDFLFPNANNSVSPYEGTAIIGYNVVEKKLYTYTGSEWRELSGVETDIGGIIIDPRVTLDSLHDFYFDVSLRDTSLRTISFSPNVKENFYPGNSYEEFRLASPLWKGIILTLVAEGDNQYASIQEGTAWWNLGGQFGAWLMKPNLEYLPGDVLVVLQPVSKFGEKEYGSFVVHYDNSIYFKGYDEDEFTQVSSFSKDHENLGRQVTLWRDSILKGEVNQTLISLPYKVSSTQETFTGNYYVERLDPYLVVRYGDAVS